MLLKVKHDTEELVSHGAEVREQGITKMRAAYEKKIADLNAKNKELKGKV